MGERIGLHPLVVIFALLAFGQLFGFVGVMMALPVSAALVVVVKLAQARYLASRFIAADAEARPMAPPIRTVRLILGDQLNIRHPGLPRWTTACFT